MTASTTTETLAPAMGGYPITVTFDTEQRVNRLWGIPVLGWTVRWIALIPHFIVLWVLEFLLGLSILVSWVPVLLTGRQADIFVSFYVTAYRYATRVIGWAFFLAGPYPPILPGDSAYPINVDYNAADRNINRLWGIPFLGLWVRALLIIPAAFLLFILYFPIAFLTFFTGSSSCSTDACRASCTRSMAASCASRRGARYGP